MDTAQGTDLIPIDPIVASVLLLAGVLASKASSRLGVPALLLFLLIGMLAGEEGLLGIALACIAPTSVTIQSC